MTKQEIERKVCLTCYRRQCNFRNGDRETCPREPRLPQLYAEDSENEVKQAPADSWEKSNPSARKEKQ